MRVAVFSAQEYEQVPLQALAADYGQEFTFFPVHLNQDTVKLAAGYKAVCCFVNDHLNAEVLKQLQEQGTEFIALRSAGFNHVDVNAAKKHQLTISRVPDYSPYAVAEFAVSLMLTLNRKIIRAHARVRENNFLLNGLLGFDVHGKTIGVVGTGKIGTAFLRIMHGFGCRLIAHDPEPSAECEALGVSYVGLETLFTESDIISLHCPLLASTRHIINHASINKMREGVMLINTGRGGLMDTKAIIDGLKARKIGYLGMDVYEEEENLFFEDHSSDILDDDDFARLQTFPNVLITGHQAFFTEQALHNIFDVTLKNIQAFESAQPINTLF